MSADSMNTVASEPVPTTPNDIVSAEMDRYGWTLIDDNIKVNQDSLKEEQVLVEESEELVRDTQDLEGLKYPFRKMEIERREPGQPQEYFCWTHSRFKEVLASRLHLEALSDAMNLANRLIFSHRGLDIAGYHQASHGTKTIISDLSRSHPWTIIFQNRVPGRQFARFNQDRPHEIIFDFDVS